MLALKPAAIGDRMAEALGAASKRLLAFRTADSTGLHRLCCGSGVDGRPLVWSPQLLSSKSRRLDCTTFLTSRFIYRLWHWRHLSVGGHCCFFHSPTIDF